MQQVTVAALDVDEVEAGLLGVLRRANVVLGDALELGVTQHGSVVHDPRTRIQHRMPIRHARRRAPPRPREATRVRQLETDEEFIGVLAGVFVPGAQGVAERNEAGHGVDRRVEIELPGGSRARPLERQRPRRPR